MEPVSVGWLSILPPVIAIVLALVTKEVISSLLIGILSGTLIYSIAAGLNPVVGTVETTFSLMGSRIDVDILLFLALLGALVCVMGRTRPGHGQLRCSGCGFCHVSAPQGCYLPSLYERHYRGCKEHGFRRHHPDSGLDHQRCLP